MNRKQFSSVSVKQWQTNNNPRMSLLIPDPLFLHHTSSWCLALCLLSFVHMHGGGSPVLFVWDSLCWFCYLSLSRTRQKVEHCWLFPVKYHFIAFLGLISSEWFFGKLNAVKRRLDDLSSFLKGRESIELNSHFLHGEVETPKQTKVDSPQATWVRNDGICSCGHKFGWIF